MKGHWVYSVGQKLGELELISFSRKGFWLAKCSCGNEIEISTNHLYRKKSCGCKSKASWFQSKRLLPQEIVANCLYSTYKSKAKQRKLEFTLTKQDFMELLYNPCTYCKMPPMNTYCTYRNKYAVQWNGIDR